MKLLKIAAVALIAAGAVWTGVTYPKIGQLTYAEGGKLEARVYGFHETFVDIGEQRIAAYIGGPADARETVVLLHGYSADKQVWPRFARHLVDTYRVIIPDLAGHGETGFKPEWNYSAPAQAQRVALLLDKLGIQQAHIAGNSMGGFISAHFALAYPQRTLSVGLIDAAGIHSPEPSDLMRMLAAGRNPFIVHSRAEFDEFYAMTMAKPPFMPGYVLAGVAQSYMSRQAELQKIFEDFADHDAVDARLSEITEPTLVLWGRDDRILHVSGAEVWKNGLPNAQLVIHDGIGHMPMVEEPAEAAAVYRQFISAKR